ncbi:unnamed protein product, partial [Symbiodinium microadriaticum]
MLVPLTFELSSLKGLCRLLPGRAGEAQRQLPATDGENIRDLPLPNTTSRGPPPEWVEKNGRTPRCRACRLRGFPAEKAQKCRDRYAEFVRNSFDPSRAIIDQAPLEDEGHGVGDVGGDFDHDLGLDAPDDLDLPPRDLPDDVNPEDYEPSEAGIDNELLVDDGSEPIAEPAPEELDFMQVDHEPLEALPEEDRDAFMSGLMYRESAERVDGKENHIVRCRVVARDFAQ